MTLVQLIKASSLKNVTSNFIGQGARWILKNVTKVRWKNVEKYSFLLILCPMHQTKIVKFVYNYKAEKVKKQF